MVSHSVGRATIRTSTPQLGQGDEPAHADQHFWPFNVSLGGDGAR